MKKSSYGASVPLRLFDPRRGDVAFEIKELQPGDLHQPQRCNCFTILWIHQGAGDLHVGLNSHRFEAPTLLFVSPYQTFFLQSESAMKGARLQFHANFFCIETYHEEIGCNGVLFNDAYGRPLVHPDPEQATEFAHLVSQMENELRSAHLAQSELLVSYLKVFLIKATRTKMQVHGKLETPQTPRGPVVLEKLIALIETHFRQKRAPGDYAAMLNISPKALGKLVKTHFGITLTALIRERTLNHAKWQLLHTTQPVKEVAAEVGFGDELYFSRLFRRHTGLAPTAFRDFETAIRSGRNLSM